MKIFDYFPSHVRCFLCDKSTDAPCVLVPVDGTGDGMIIEALPIHTACLIEGMRVNFGLGIVYRRSAVPTFPE